MESAQSALKSATFRGWWVSGVLHALLLLTAVLMIARAPGPANRRLPVDLAARSTASDLPGRAFGPSFRSPPAPRRTVPPRPLAIPAPVPLPLPIRPRTAGASREPLDRLAAESWSERSLADWIEDCRAGKSVRDSILERPRSVQEKGRERLVAALNREFRGRRWEWELERFREEYVRNFPLMR